jgi:hypothetical protein
LRNSSETGLAGMGDDRRRCVASGSCPIIRQRGSRDGPHRFPQSQPASSVPEAATGSPQASARAQGRRIEANKVLSIVRCGGAKRPPFPWAASSGSHGPAKASDQVGSSSEFSAHYFDVMRASLEENTDEESGFSEQSDSADSPDLQGFPAWLSDLQGLQFESCDRGVRGLRFFLPMIQARIKLRSNRPD